MGNTQKESSDKNEVTMVKIDRAVNWNEAKRIVEE